MVYSVYGRAEVHKEEFRSGIRGMLKSPPKIRILEEKEENKPPIDTVDVSSHDGTFYNLTLKENVTKSSKESSK